MPKLMRTVMRYYKIWLPLLSIVLFISFAEFICRSISLVDKYDADFKFYIRNVDDDLKQAFMAEDASLMWFPKPNYHDGLININSQGFRDKERTVKKDRNIFRILCLGDSSTFGVGVYLEETYHALLEEKLNKEYSRSGTRFEVINAGVTGYTSYQGLRLYKQKGYRYKPDIVTFYLGTNDYGKRFHLSDKQIIPDNIISDFNAAIENNILLKLNSYRLLRKCIFNLFGMSKNSTGEKVQRVSSEDYEKNIQALNRLCRKNGSRLLLISIPFNKKEIDRLNFNARADFVLNQLENISKTYDIPLLHIPEMSKGMPFADNSQLFLDVLHPSPAGHRIIMERLCSYLVINKLLPDK